MPHLRIFHRSLIIFRAAGFAALAAALALGLPETLPAQQFGRDPVQELRQALKRKDTAATRGPNLEKKASAVQSPGDISRALLLIEWGINDPDREISQVDSTVYANLIDR